MLSPKLEFARRALISERLSEGEGDGGEDLRGAWRADDESVMRLSFRRFLEQ